MRDFPVLIFAISLVGLWLSAKAGTHLCRRRGKLEEDERADLNIILTASLTLLSLIIGFSFSMAITRYDLRKGDEAAEANAIGTEFARAGLLSASDAARLRELLRSYLNQRVLFYTARKAEEVRRIDAATAQTQAALWSAVVGHNTGVPAPIAALVDSGMNDVLNSQAYTQAAWWNRIPAPAWILMAAIAVCSNCLFGYAARRAEGHGKRLLLLPIFVSVSFFLIADIDSPRGGVIRVHPQNLESLCLQLECRCGNEMSPRAGFLKVHNLCG
jgi:hypothetical protein